MLLVAAGVTPNIDLAARAGLAVNRGVLVDDHLRTGDPSIYAVGDVAEFDGRVWGLWPVAVAQAQVAAGNIAGGDRSFEDEIPTMILKGVVSTSSRSGASKARAMIGSSPIVARAATRIASSSSAAAGSPGGVFLGFGEDAQHAQDARSSAREFAEAEIDTIAAGDWSPLQQRSPVPA